MMKKTKTIIEWETPCKLIHCDGWRCFMEARTFQDFKKIIDAALKKNPGEPIRLDVHDQELVELKKIQDRYRGGSNVSLHREILRDWAGFLRCVFYPPGMPMPKTDAEIAKSSYTTDEIVEGFVNRTYDHHFMEPVIEELKSKNEVLTDGHRELGEGNAMLQAALATWKADKAADMLSDWRRAGEATPDLKSMTSEERVWLALRISKKGETKKYGTALYPSQTDIARAMSVHRQRVYRIEKKMEARHDIRRFLDALNIPPRKKRG